MSELKDLGTVHWKRVIERRLYSKALLLNKRPPIDIGNIDAIALETISNTNRCYKLQVQLDYAFLVSKMQHHFCVLFDAGQKEAYLDLCNKAWSEYVYKDMDTIAKDLSNTLGGSKQAWLDKLQDILCDDI